jgi:Na+/melibiose symporter-like transporter
VQSAARNAGYALGGIAGAVTVSAGGTGAYLSLAAVNAASYLVVAAVVANWRIATVSMPAEPTVTRAARPVRYLDIIKHRPLLVIVGANLPLVVCMNVLSVLVTVYLTNVLGQPAWLGGAFLTVNTVLVLLAQTRVTNLVGMYRRCRVVQGASFVWVSAFACFWLLRVVPASLVQPGALLAIGVYTLAEMLYAPTINALAVDTAPPAASGRYLAIYQLSWSVGSALAPMLLIWLLSLGADWLWPMLMMMCVLGALGIRTMRS